MTLIKSNSFSVAPTKNDEIKETKEIKQPKQVQKILDSIGVDTVKPVKQKNEDPKLSKSENIQNTVEKSIEKIQNSGKPLSSIKVEELSKVKEGLKKIEAGSGVDKNQSIPKTALEKGLENLKETFNKKNELSQYISGDSDKEEALYNFSKKEFSTENLDFLNSVKSFMKNPSMSSLSELYNSEIKHLNIEAKYLKELPIEISKGNIAKSLDLLNGVTLNVITNVTDTFLRFNQTPEYESIKIKDAKLQILNSIKPNPDEKFGIKSFINSPDKFKVFEKFSLKDQSYEDIKFLGSVNKIINKPDLSLGDLSNLYINYLSPKGAGYINMTSKEQKLVNEFKACLDNKDISGALEKLPDITSKSVANATDPFARFIMTDEYKDTVQKEILNSINKELNGQPVKDKFDQNKVESMPEFIKFAEKSYSKENLDFLDDVRKLLPKPTMENLIDFQKKYDLDQKTTGVNVSGKSAKAFNDAIKAGDYNKAFDSLPKLVSDIKITINDTYNQFKSSDDIKPLLQKEIFKPIEKLPIRSQLKAIDEAIKDNPSIANILNTRKTELLEKYLPKISLTNEDQNISKFVSGFKKATDHFKTNLFGGEIKNVYKALDKLEEAISISPDIKNQLDSFDTAIKQVELFINKRGKESSKIEWVEALGGRLQEAKQILTEKYSQTQGGKLNQVGNATNNIIQSVKSQKINNFEEIAEQLKTKAKEIIKKDPFGEISWSVSTLFQNNILQSGQDFIGIKTELLDKVNSEFPKLKIEQKQILVDKIFEGLKEELPVKLVDEKNISKIIVDGEVYTAKEEIASGAFGLVLKYENENGKALAVKSMNKNKGVDDFLKEVEAHRLATGKIENESPYVTKFKGAIIADKRDNVNYLSIQEFADGGDLKSAIKNINNALGSKKYSKEDILNLKRYISENIIKGMVHISENRDMMHLDIKPENILFDKSSGIFKISDFGISDKSSLKEGSGGTIGYVAPEMYNTNKYDNKSDQWSIGLTLQELMVGEKVFEEKSEMHDKSKEFVNSGRSLREVEGKTDPTELGKMINSLVQADPTKRPKFSEILKTPYFQDPIGTDERAKELLKEILG
ncbi:MAG: protein kinase [Candidatus Sericytochromatia bacterium]